MSNLNLLLVFKYACSSALSFALRAESNIQIGFMAGMYAASDLRSTHQALQ